jgi:hypothetical protein
MALKEGVEQIQAQNISGITLGVRLTVACALGVTGSSEGIQRLKQYLDETKLADYHEVDPEHPTFRAAARSDTLENVLQAADNGSADDLIEALIQNGTLSPEAGNAP